MAARASSKSIRNFLLRRRRAPIGIEAARHCSSTASKPPKLPKIPLFPKGSSFTQTHFAKWSKGLFTASTLGLIIAGGAYASTVDEETFCCASLFHGWVPREKRQDSPILGLEVRGRKFSNPIGLAAGFDKNAEAVDGLLGLGFGFVEIGSVTPVPQEGNLKPHVFRLRNGDAIINHYGFNSDGIIAVAKRLGIQHGKRMLDETSSTSSPSADEAKSRGKSGPGILGVNLGKNKTSADAASDYVQGVHSLSQYADYLVINVSSPNTPGLRMLQRRKELNELVKKVQAARDEMQWGEEGPPPLLVKIAPDLSREDLEDIAAVARNLHLDGLGKIPLIGCGGIFSGEDTYRKLRAGATLVQLYTGFAYGGPALIPQIKKEMASKALLKQLAQIADDSAYFTPQMSEVDGICFGRKHSHDTVQLTDINCFSYFHGSTGFSRECSTD